MISMTQMFWSALLERGEPIEKPTIRTSARRIQYHLPSYKQQQKSTAYSSPGRGVSGESTN